MLFKIKYSYLASIAILAGCLTVSDSSPSFAASKDVGSGETIADQVIPTTDYDTINVYDNGTANNTTVGSSGTLNVEVGGTANTATINSGGIMNISNNGTASNVTVNSGGELNISSYGGTVNGLTVNEGGRFDMSTDATVTNGNFYGQSGSVENKTAANVIVSDSSVLTVNSDGTANNTTVRDYGDLIIREGGTANNTTVEDGGKIIATDGNSTINGLTVKEDGGFEFTTNTTVTNMKNGTGQSMGSIQNGKAQNVVVNEDSELTVTSNSSDGSLGSADGTKVEGGDMTVTAGSSATNTTVSGYGNLTVNGGGSATKVTVTDSGDIEVGSGGSVSDATLTGNSETEKATITVENGGQASNTTLNSYSEMSVENGGVADLTTVGSGAELNVDGGKVTNTTVNSGGLITNNSSSATIDGLTINNGGKFDLSTDATVSNANINGNNMGSIADKKAQDFLINNGSNLTVSAGGSATNTTVQNGGTITATEKGVTVDGVKLENGGQFNFSTDATVSNIKDAGGNTLSSEIKDNTASGFKVTSGSTLTAANGGTIDMTGVTGGTVVAENGGTIKNTAIGDNGTIRAEAGSTIDGVTIVAATGGKFDLSTNATVTNTDIDGKSISIQDNKAVGLEINDGSKLTADANGSAEDITVNGGNLTVNANASAEKVTVKAGTADVIGGTLSDVTITQTGQVTAMNGGRVNSATVSNNGTLKLNENGEASGTIIDANGVVIAGQYGAVNDTTVKASGSLTVENGGRANTTNIEANGNMTVQNGANAVNTIVSQKGVLTSESGATIEGLEAQRGSVINLADGTTLSGNLTMDKNADASGSTLDFSNLFSNGGTSPSSLTLNNGLNDAFKGKLINTSTEDKTLVLNGGNYKVSNDGQNGSVQIGGWDMIHLSDGTMRLETDLTMSGTNKTLSVNEGAKLDVSGTLDNVLKITLNGNLVNSGTIDMAETGDSALDELIINGNYEAATGSQLVLNINPRTNTADKLTIGGDVSGKTSVYLKSSSAKVPDGNILFADAPNNTTGNADSFEIWRVEGSPYTWDTLFENNKWYTYVSDADRPNIVPETAAYYGLIDNTFMQTTSLSAGLRNNITENEFLKTPCRVPNYLKYTNRICRSSRPVFAGWAAPVYSNATIQAPYNYTASITGFDGGLDLISNGWTKLGLLGSYRNGLYKYEDSGDTYQLKGEAETTINSYLAGLYIRHDSANWSIIAAAYAGMLDIDVSSDDGVNADTTGSTYGATLDVNYIYQNISGIRIEPGVRLSYTSVKIDEIEDNAGKRSEFDNADRTEIEIGIRLAQRWEFPDAKAEIFVKPSIVQTMNSGSTFELVEERLLDSTEDRTFAKVEAGVSFDMINNWNAALGASYSVGSDYDNVSANLAVRYNF